ncbi:Altered inheritance of mitochondria protein 6 [Friedmanniomyces endolithicus]|uniref:Altered inheritance of mitochondria protein 6 n=1 Tax=Friedmanniomyces endolithicus TaxID=329885 RepID=A0AAN6K812_9PEZI|nr:Altered inheritance of mitochondria protein 6 [Friedmanniomyces endolithicus]KAK0810424.1 Altered inheritance of mitochondria protein 6 [Friedmanniomyces endolithicus]KAK0846943.1 Altered inheritance of mitochondria protein 6 [Friedmanniomyces endolithicus]KAK0876220.1 Altered inheritance of mitochondria protein 6 [Friedmanniomyces endolithicus]KAK0969127.1 Altered inheritance of mitochondria protein 6 [Friedmanniomyces endolithicus]
MATPLLRNKLASEGSYTPDGTSDARSTTSDYVDSIEDGDLSDYGHHHATPASRPSTTRSILRALGVTAWRRKSGYHDYEPAGGKYDDGPMRAPRRSPQRDIRRCRISYVMGWVKRGLLAAPFLILMFFGVLHILHAVLGRAQIFWDVDVGDDYLPHWAQSGRLADGLARYPTDATRDVLPIPCHSHNDYWRHVPLFDAISWGCTGVEADVWLFDEELYIGHNLASLTRNRTFQSLYVNPLVDLLDRMNPQTDFVNASGHGVFDTDPSQTLVLLVDFKTHGPEAFPVVSRQLEALRSKGYLTFWDGQKVNSRAVTVVATGHAPFNLVANASTSTHRDIFFDAPLDKLWEAPRSPISRDDPLLHDSDADLDYGDAMARPDPNPPASTTDLAVQSTFNTTNSYYASASFAKTLGFVWRGHLSPRQMDILRGHIRGAKHRGLKARYWDTPSWPVGLRNHVWHVLMKEGAEVLNVDDLQAAAVDQWKGRVHQWW